jgi:hypothetical protein
LLSLIHRQSFPCASAPAVGAATRNRVESGLHTHTLSHSRHAQKRKLRTRPIAATTPGHRTSAPSICANRRARHLPRRALPGIIIARRMHRSLI